MTVSGYTAFKVSSFRPQAPIYIFSNHQSMLKSLNLLWGVQCFYYDQFSSTDETIEDCTIILKNAGLVQTGDTVINTGSMPLEQRLSTNFLKVTEVE